ncbi:MAG: 23S rRNA (adenine(2030)-N(6))-methyltransferase RlmJ, partial [Proteobacteria bacterium]|nr:23S rRNA (adenine(2030)-N(6))-methyltransferase RlmJ [Pseudomonadota bacterium]
RARAALEDAQRRFASGVYVLWYPVVQRRESQQFPESLKRLQRKDWLHATLTVMTPSAGGYGLHGSGLFVLNPPWTLPGMLQEALPYLAKVLGQDAGAGFELESELA